MKLKNAKERDGCIGSSFDEEEALACNGQSEVAPGLGAMLPSVYLIETAMQCETVAVEYSVSGLDLASRRHRRMDSRRDVLGCSRKRKERLDNLEKKDRNLHQHEIRDAKTERRNDGEKALNGLLRTNVHQKSRQEALDTKGSFREVPPAVSPFSCLNYFKSFQPGVQQNSSRRRTAQPHGSLFIAASKFNVRTSEAILWNDRASLRKTGVAPATDL